MMTQRAFGKTGLMVSPLGFGSAPVGLLETDQKTTGQILNLLLDQGVNLIDTGECYAGAEAMIGRTVSHRRAEYVLVTKVGHKFPGATGADWSPALIRQSVENSLRLLRTDRLDVVLLHTPDLATLKRGDALAVIVEARAAGKIRFVGFSGDNEEAAYASTLPDVRVIEMSVNLADQTNIALVLPAAVKRNLGVIAKRPMANAAWRIGTLGEFYNGYAQPYAQRLAKMGLQPADLGLTGPAAQTWSEIALRFTLSIPGVHTAIVGTANPENARANLDFAGQGPLPAATVEKIRAAFQQANENWRGLT